jgi:hypothetical protein
MSLPSMGGMPGAFSDSEARCLNDLRLELARLTQNEQESE